MKKIKPNLSLIAWSRKCVDKFKSKSGFVSQSHLTQTDSVPSSILSISKDFFTSYPKSNRKYFLGVSNVIIALLLSFLIVGCSDDDNDYIEVDGNAPIINLTTSHIKTEQGRKFQIVGSIKDNDGIRNISLKNEGLSLDKTIDLSRDSIVYEYDLNYMFQTKKDLEGESFDLVITVTDLGGRTTAEVLKITMDGDFVNPIFKISPASELIVLLKAEPKLSVKFLVEDDKALGSVSIEIPELEYSQLVTTFTNNGKTLDFNDEIVLPAVLASYNLSIFAQDKSGLSTQVNSKITVSEMPDFEKMYLSDVDKAEQLNSDIFGIPMLIDHTGKYEYSANYYSEKAGTMIKFIPQKTDFSPICFGIDPANSEILSDNPDVSEAIVLPAKGYYKIVFNVKTGKYSTTPYVPTDVPVAIGSAMYLNDSDKGAGTMPLEIGLVGGGIPGAGDWKSAEVLVLKQDNENKYLFSVEMTLEAGNTIDFNIQTKHPWGWWPEPFWRWDSKENPEKNVYNGGENPAKWKINTSGKYMFKFDSHLKRSKLYPIN